MLERRGVHTGNQDGRTENPHCFHPAELSNWTVALPFWAGPIFTWDLSPTRQGLVEASCCPLPPELLYLSWPPETPAQCLQPTEGAERAPRL